MKSITEQIHRRPPRPFRSQKGQALPAVLILLLIGGLLIAPMLIFMASGLYGIRVMEERTNELYAAGAGIEDAIYKIQHKEVPSDVELQYVLDDNVNRKSVEVTIAPQDNTMIEFFETIGALKPGGQGNYNRKAPHGGSSDNPWVTVYSPIASEPGVYDTYQIEVTFVGQGNASILNLGCWINGLYDEEGQAAAITGVEPGSMSIEYPDCILYTVRFSGTAFRWEWPPAKGPEFKPDDVMTQTFTFSPAITLEEGERFPPNVAWAAQQRKDIFITWQGDYSGFSKIISVAISPETGKQTAVESYVIAEFTGVDPDELGAITIVSWIVK